MGKRTDYAALRQGFGLARRLSDEFIQACERVNPPIEAINRLVTPNGRTTMDELVRRAVADWQAEQQQPEVGELHGHPYRNGGQTTNDVIWIGEVEVDYGIRPTYAELNGGWFDWANERFSDMKPELRDIVAKPVPTNGVIKRRFGYVHLSRNATDEEALAEIAKRRMVPATDLELMYFGKAFPEEQRKLYIAALRSFVRIDSRRKSAVLCGDDSERDLSLISGTASYPWYDHYCFLVREDGE